MNPKTNSQLTISIQKDPISNNRSSQIYNFIKNKRFPYHKINKSISNIKKTNQTQTSQQQNISIDNSSHIKLEKQYEIKQPKKKIFFENFVLPKINTSLAINNQLQESKIIDENRQYSKRKSQLLKQLMLLYQNDQSLSNITLKLKDCTKTINTQQFQKYEQSRILKEQPQGKIQRRSQIVIEQQYHQTDELDLSDARLSNSYNLIDISGISITKKDIIRKRTNISQRLRKQECFD